MNAKLYMYLLVAILFSQLNENRWAEIQRKNIEKIKVIVSYDQVYKNIEIKQITVDLDEIASLNTIKNNFSVINENLYFHPFGLGIVKKMDFKASGTKREILRIKVFVGTQDIENTHELLLQDMIMINAPYELAYKRIFGGPGDFCISNSRSTINSAINYIIISRRNYAFSIRTYYSKINLMPIAKEIDNYILNAPENDLLKPKFNPEIEVQINKMKMTSTIKVDEMWEANLQIETLLLPYQKMEVITSKKYASASLNNGIFHIKGREVGIEEIYFIVYDTRTLRSISFKKEIMVE